jgi:hypothetical protein
MSGEGSKHSHICYPLSNTLFNSVTHTDRQTESALVYSLFVLHTIKDSRIGFEYNIKDLVTEKNVKSY